MFLLKAALVAALVLSGLAAADASQYPATLYLSGASSGILGGSDQLVASKGISANAVGSTTWGLTWGVASPQVALTGAVGSDPGPSTGLGLAGNESYSYRFTLVDAGGETVASVASNTVTANQRDVTVSGLPTGVTVRLYRLNSVGAYKLVTTLTNNASSTYLDTTIDANTGVALPQAQNRANLSSGGSATGYYDFAPGAALSNPNITNGNANPSMPAATAAFDGKGWIADGTGGVAFPAGTWQLTTKLSSSGSSAATAGTARLVIGIWKVDGSGNVDGSPLVDPTCSTSPCASGGQPGENSSGANIALGSGTSSAIASSFALPFFTIPSGDHLYVQFFRHQTAAALSGSTIVTMNAYDNVAALTHPAASTLPNTPALATPAAGAATNSDTLTATFSDPDAGDTGTLAFNLCSDSACSNVLASSTSVTLANGANASWTPTSLADGTYWWEAKATDAIGGQSSWTTPQSFTFDTTPPQTTIGTSPASLSNSGGASFTFSSNESGSTFQCQLDAGSYSSCTSSQSYSGLADGSHTFRVKATDPAGNTDPTPDTATWTVDTTAPQTTIGTGPASLTTSTGASFTFSSNESGSTFQCQLDAGSYATCTSPKSYSGLADGSHTFNVRATDPAGNTDATPDTATWTVDTTPPQTTIGTSPANPTNSSGASFSFSSNETGSTFQCQLDAGGYSACTSPKSYSGLADGSHTFKVKATDPAGNTDPTPDTTTWTVDTTPPQTTIGTSPANLSNSGGASFTFSSNESGSTFQCQLDAGGYSACTSPKSYSGLADGSHTFKVKATDPAGNTDPTPDTAAWTVDTTPPHTTIGTSPASPSNSSGATFSFSSSESGSTFQCQLDAGSYSACTSPKSYSGLADGSHTFKVKATDPAGNTDPTPDTATWTVDTTPPHTTINTAPTDPSDSTIATFTFSSSESGSTFQCELDRDGYSACTSPQIYGHLTAGGHTFNVKATDGAGNTDPTAASDTWTVGGPPPHGANDGPTAAPAPVPVPIAVLVTPSAPAGSSGSGAAPVAQAPLTVHFAGARTLSCPQTSRISLHIKLRRKANVAVRFLTAAGVPLGRTKLTTIRAGSRTLNLQLPFVLAKGKSYRVIVTASVSGRTVKDEIKLTITRVSARTKTSAATCG